MRKRDPENVKADLDVALGNVEAMLSAALPATTSAARQQLCEAAFLAAAVLWEGFVSDLFIAHLNRDLSRYLSFVERAVVQSAQEKYGKAVILGVSLKHPKHLNVKSIAEMIDPQS